MIVLFGDSLYLYNVAKLLMVVLYSFRHFVSWIHCNVKGEPELTDPFNLFMS